MLLLANAHFWLRHMIENVNIPYELREFFKLLLFSLIVHISLPFSGFTICWYDSAGARRQQETKAFCLISNSAVLCTSTFLWTGCIWFLIVVSSIVPSSGLIATLHTKFNFLMFFFWCFFCFLSLWIASVGRMASSCAGSLQINTSRTTTTGTWAKCG